MIRCRATSAASLLGWAHRPGLRTLVGVGDRCRGTETLQRAVPGIMAWPKARHGGQEDAARPARMAGQRRRAEICSDHQRHQHGSREQRQCDCSTQHQLQLQRPPRRRAPWPRAAPARPSTSWIPRLATAWPPAISARSARVLPNPVRCGFACPPRRPLESRLLCQLSPSKQRSSQPPPLVLERRRCWCWSRRRALQRCTRPRAAAFRCPLPATPSLPPTRAPALRPSGSNAVCAPVPIGPDARVPLSLKLWLAPPKAPQRPSCARPSLDHAHHSPHALPPPPTDALNPPTTHLLHAHLPDAAGLLLAPERTLPPTHLPAHGSAA